MITKKSIFNQHELTLINLYGGPGAGKSTVALSVAGEMRRQGYSVELVAEDIKYNIYANNYSIFENQVKILGDQIQRLHSMDNKVKYAVLDSPLLQQTVYTEDAPESFKDLVRNINGTFKAISFFVARGDFEFEQKGRIHNKEQSLVLDRLIMDELDRNNINSYRITSSDDGIAAVLATVYEYEHRPKFGGI